MFDIEEELKKLPAKPGVYLMHNERDEIIYVGKAVRLKNRVRQYFQDSRNLTPKIARMVSHIARFEYIITDSELEALVLECNLIKEYRPKYNTMLTDDKTYPYIKVTTGEAYPRILFSRLMKKDKSKYFGPYTSAGAVKDTIELLRKIYKIRTCHRNLPKDIGIGRPCLYYHIGQCDAPCQGNISQEDYQKQIHQVLQFLGGNYEPVIQMLTEKMMQASEAMAYEKAMEYRDLIRSIRQITEKQKVTSSQMEDRDVIGLARAGNEAVVQVFFIRNGRLIGRDHYYLTGVENESRAGVLTSFVKQFYGESPFVPRELMVPEGIEDEEIILQWLSEKRGQKVALRVPKKGQKERLVELACKNAMNILNKDSEKMKREEARTVGAVRELADLLGLPLLTRMEAYDISNTSGFEKVGSMVVYEKGKPKRSAYRKFKIRDIQGQDDYHSLEEVLTRRFTHGQREQKELEAKNMDPAMGSFSMFPDLILMDGGKGQVHIAQKVLMELGLDIPVCGMVKDDFHRTRGIYFDDEEIAIDRNSEAFRLVTRIQDEAHRFAIEYHRSLRSKTQVKSILEDIPGIGETRRKALMRYYGDIQKIREASVEDLKQVPSMNEKAAESVYGFFRKQPH
ncbi:excinuclease ABC subunit UvrC [Frisingicoccus caecimuris]|uniref:UvrABC system protein C n=1 Tax=Frisingicoccus caecimuris TaxID=1796636 RepID=A0A4R2LCI5_9FIRM|nr:excinuclease ABC subunit UvrC [Frisingicoccus caecimuris]MCR1917723.1 excinuclease ABC subunit UvrC [Frisingicoccus caecimuris]TCO85997.1 excinuclease ABC subunit C [Frisingicoccus caecimuris]